MSVLILSLIDNATLAGKRSTLYIFSYTGLSYTCCVVQQRLSSRSIQVYTHVCTAHREGSSSPSEYSEISNRLHSSIKKIDNRDGRRGRKINDGIRKGMPLRRLAAVIDFPDSAEVSDTRRDKTHRRSRCRLHIADSHRS